MDDGVVEEIKRHFGVVAESLRSEIRAVAEGQVLLRDELTDLRSELKRDIRDLADVVRLTHTETGSRLKDLEGRVDVVERRP